MNINHLKKSQNVRLMTVKDTPRLKRLSGINQQPFMASEKRTRSQPRKLSQIKRR